MTSKGKQEASSDSWDSHVQPHGEIRELYKGKIWEVISSLFCFINNKVRGTFGGKETNRRNMTIYKLDDDSLLCISVIALNEKEMKKLLEIGKPSVTISLN